MADDTDNEDLTSTLEGLRNTMSELTDPSTTVEAQTYSRRILNRRLQDPYAKKEDELVTDLEKQAEQARQTLRAAREKLLARRYNPSDAWFALAAALGSPTKTGSLMEALGNTAGAMREPLQKKFDYETNQQTESLKMQQEEEGLGRQLDILKLNQLNAQRTAENPLAVEALKTLGKSPKGPVGVKDKASIAVDKAYAPEYLEWIQNGEPEAKGALTELGNARDNLRGWKMGPDGQPQAIRGSTTGPIVGSIATLPMVGKPLQDLLFPHSANTQEMVESTVQRSLRPILGAQFTEKEGERLISRVYNPRLKPEVNALRLERLMAKLAVAYKNKQAAADYFKANGTMTGYDGQLRKYTIDDFMPDHTWEGEAPGLPKEQTDEGDEPPEGRHGPDDDLPATDPKTGKTALKPGQKVISYDQYLKERKKRLGYAEGGSVEDVMVQMPDGSMKSLAELDAAEKPSTATATPAVTAEPPAALDSPDAALPGPAKELAAAGTGAAAGLAALKSATGIRDLFGSSPGERRLVALLEKAKLPPEVMASNVRKGQRSGVPSMALDEGPPGARELLGEALPGGGDSTETLLNRLVERQNSSRGRVEEHVNKALKPDDYLTKQKDLLDELSKNSKPLYDAAYQQFPSVRSKALLQLMETPSGKKAVKAAMKSIRDTPGATMGKADALGMVSKPSLPFLDQVKREFDDMIIKEEGSGKDYKPTAKGKQLRALRSALVSEVDRATTDPQTGVSPWAEARNQYSGDLEMVDALRTGKEDFAKMDPGEVAAAVKKMSFAEKDAFRTGVAQSLYKTINGPSADINAARRLAGSPAMRAKITTLFDSPNEARVFLAALDREMGMFDQSRELVNQRGEIANASTRPKAKLVKPADAPKVYSSPLLWTVNLFRKKPGMSDKESAAIVDALKSSTPEELTAMVSRLGPQFGRRLRRSKAMGKVGAIGATAGALGELYHESQAEPIAKAEGGKVSRLTQILESLRNDAKNYDSDWMKDRVQHAAVNNGMAPGEMERMLTGQPSLAQAPIPPVPPRATVAGSSPLTNPINAELARLGEIQQRLRSKVVPQQAANTQGAFDPHTAEALHTASLVAEEVAHQATQNPTDENLRRLREVVTQFETQIPKKHGGSVHG